MSRTSFISRISKKRREDVKANDLMFSFRVVQIHVSHFKHILTAGDQTVLANNLSSWRDSPALYHGHFAYFDPHRLGVEVTPIYINLIRQPLARLVSHYYFLRYGDDVLVNKVRAKEGDTTTFDQCVELQQQDCDPKRMWLQVLNSWPCKY